MQTKSHSLLPDEEKISSRDSGVGMSECRGEADALPTKNVDEVPQPKFIIGCSDEDFEDEEEIEIVRVVPPDGGWGWVVVAASFMCNAIVDGIIFTSGMMYSRLQEEFHVSSSQVAWISSLLGGFYLLVGPFVSGLTNAFGFRAVCILGAFIGSLSCVLSYFATSIVYLYFSFGILGGIGFGLIYVPAVITTGFYFERRRALATGIAVCGSGIGNFVMSPINTALLALDQWKIIFLVYAGMILCCAFFGLAFRPLTAATGKRRTVADDESSGPPRTPLLLRIKRARDIEIANCPSALSMNSSYSRSPSKASVVDDYMTAAANGETKSLPFVARTLLERHGGAPIKRFSFPSISLPNTDPIIEESEMPNTDDSGESTEDTTVEKDTEEFVEKSLEKTVISNGFANGTAKSVLDVPPPSSPISDVSDDANGEVEDKLMLDDNKNETNQLQVGNGHCARNLSAPAFQIHMQNSNSFDTRRRSSRATMRKMSRPFYRDDIFYSGSLARISQYQSSETIEQYHASVTHLPPMSVLVQEEEEESNSKCASCINGINPVLERIFDFSLLRSITFVILALTGFLALTALFVPFNFLPNYATDLGIAPADQGFIMSLMGIFNTVGRIIAGWISDHPKVDALFVNNLALLVGGIFTVLLPFFHNLSLLYLYAIVFGLSVAAFASLRSILLVELLGLERLTNAFGLLLLFQGMAALVGSPIAGAFKDFTGEYNTSFFVFGAVFAAAGAFTIPLRAIKRWEDERIDQRLYKEKYGIA